MWSQIPEPVWFIIVLGTSGKVSLPFSHHLGCPLTKSCSGARSLSIKRAKLISISLSHFPPWKSSRNHLRFPLLPPATPNPHPVPDLVILVVPVVVPDTVPASVPIPVPASVPGCGFLFLEPLRMGWKSWYYGILKPYKVFCGGWNEGTDNGSHDEISTAP